MDRNNEDQKTEQWVDDRMASLNADANWSPNSSQAFERLDERRRGVRGQTPNSGGRRWMAVAVSAAIGLVLFSLPWRQLRSVIKPSPSSQSMPQAQTSEPQETQTQIQNVAPPQPEPRVPPVPSVEEPPSKSILAKKIETKSEAATSRELGFTPIPPVQGFQGFAAQAQDEPKTKKSPGPTAIPPQVIKTILAAYTDEARAAHIQGRVTLQVTVHKDGTASVTKVVQGLGYGLDEAAIRAVEQFQFEPGTMDGQAVETQARLAVNFKLL